MYNFITENYNLIPKIDLKKGIITTVKETNGTVCSSTGYLRFKLNKKLMQVHQVLAVLYFGEKCIGMEINHKDGNKMNNCKDNLEPITKKENVDHQWKNGLASSKHAQILTDDQVIYIRSVFISKNRKYGISALSKKLGVAKSTVSNVVNYKTYKDIV